MPPAFSRTVTPDSGQYQFVGVPPGSFLLQVQKDGFRTQTTGVTIQKSSSKDLDVSLELAGVNQQVIVTAEGGAQMLDEVSKPITVVSAAEIENRNVNNISDMLTTTPGVTIQNLGGPGQWTTISSRGLRADATAVLVDGIRLRDSANPQGDISSFIESMTVVNVDHVEVLRGSGSSLYGTNAVGGTINLVTKEGGGPFHGQIQLEGGSLGMYRGRASLGGGALQDRLQYSVGLVTINVMEGVDGHSPWRNSGVQGQLRYNLTPRMSVTGRFWGTDDFLMFGNSPTNSVINPANLPASGPIPAIPATVAQANAFALGGSPNFGNATFVPNVWDPDDRRASHFLAGAVTFKDVVSSKFNWQAIYNKTSTDRIYTNGPGGVGYQPLATNYGKYAGNIDNFDLRATADFTHWFSLSGGYEFEREFYTDHQDNNLPTPQLIIESTHAQQNSNAGYFAARLSLLNQRLQISFSGRAQSFQIKTPDFEYAGTANPYVNSPLQAPRPLTGDTSVAYTLAKTSTKLRAHVGNSYRAPGLYERFGAGFYNDPANPKLVVFTPYGDPRLAPDRYNSVDGGVDQYFFRNRIRLSGTFFYTRIVQVTEFLNILPVTDPYGRTSGYINGAGGISRGAEFSGEARPMAGMTITGSYTYTRAETDQDSTVPGYWQIFDVPRHSASLVIIKQWGKRLTTTFDMYKYSSSLNAYIGYNQAYLIPGWTKADFVGSYQFWTKESRAVRVYGKVDNLFNKTYYPEGYRASGVTALGGVGFSF